MSAELPFDAEVDAAHAEAHAAKRRRVRRLIAIRRELRPIARRRRPGGPPITETIRLRLTLDEKARIKQAAEDALLTAQDFLRAAAFAYADRMDGAS